MNKSTHNLSLILAIAALLLSLFPTTALAQDEEAEAEFEGSFTLGWRSVDVDGRDEKYRQHIGIDDGASLFGLDFYYRPKSDIADEVRLNASNLGGQPFESFDFSVRKFGNYNFKLGRRESTYFYEDIILPVELSNPRIGNAGDFHHFDFRRVRDFASLEYRITPRAKLDVAFDRYSRRGESTTTLDVSARRVRNGPADGRAARRIQSQLPVRLGQSHPDSARESYQEFDNSRHIFLPRPVFGREHQQQHDPGLLLPRPADRYGVAAALCIDQPATGRTFET